MKIAIMQPCFFSGLVNFQPIEDWNTNAVDGKLGRESIVFANLLGFSVINTELICLVIKTIL